MTVVLVLLLLVSLGEAYTIYRVARWARDKITRLEDSLHDFVSVRGDQGEKMSPLAELTDQIAQVFAARVGSSVTAALRGAIGGTMKGASSEQLAEAEGTPIGALASAIAPAQFRKLGRNPLVMAALQRIFSGLAGDGNRPTTSPSKASTRRWDL